jgi:hypothetical protein
VRLTIHTTYRKCVTIHHLLGKLENLTVGCVAIDHLLGNWKISQRRTIQHTVACVAIDHLLGKPGNLAATHHKRTIQDARLLDLSEII